MNENHRSTVEIKYEAERGCGYRQVGGLYMMSGKATMPCGRLPMEMEVCPVCNQGIKPAKGWTWIQPRELFEAKGCNKRHCNVCPVSNPPERGGLIWVGSKYYKTPIDFLKEANEVGISRRIPAVPKDFKPGTVVYLAHRQGIRMTCKCGPPPHPKCQDCDGTGEFFKPAVFAAFIAHHIEKVVGEKVTQKEIKKLRARDIVPVIVRKQQLELPDEEA